MDQNLKVILQQLEAEKSIDRETLIEAIRSAIESAARKSMTKSSDMSVEVDPNTLAFKVFDIRTVAETVEDPYAEISLEDALKLNPAVVVGNRLKVPAEPKDFGRIAAQTAKQVIIQKIKDAERDNIYEEYIQRENEIISGIVKRVSHGNVYVTIGRAEAILPHREQSPRETFKTGDRIRALLLDVEKSPRGAQLILSRTSPIMVRCLFEQEVPELYDETVTIRAISREAGSRTKVAVHSNDPQVDPVGACVGIKGSRVRAIVEELSGEKIDIVRWSEDPKELCASALNPADIINITLDEEKKSIKVMVPQDQLSLAIGKRGQNARLASKLIGWNIDIKGEGDTESVATAAFEALLEDAPEDAPEVEAAEASELPTEVDNEGDSPHTEPELENAGADDVENEVDADDDADDDAGDDVVTSDAEEREKNI